MGPGAPEESKTFRAVKETTVRYRQNSNRLLLVGLLVCCIWALASCASTEMTSVWRDSQYRGGPLKKLAIIVVNKNDLMRRMVEDEIARSLTGGTTQVLPSYTVLEKLEKDKEAIKNTLLAQGFDGALVGRVAALVKDETYRPPTTYVTFDAYYGYAYTVSTDPGYSQVDTRVVIETILYKLPEAKPIWTGTTESINPDSREELVDKLGRLIGKDLRNEKLISGP
jgi:hypothetical protein